MSAPIGLKAAPLASGFPRIDAFFVNSPAKNIAQLYLFPSAPQDEIKPFELSDKLVDLSVSFRDNAKFVKDLEEALKSKKFIIFNGLNIKERFADLKNSLNTNSLTQIPAEELERKLQPYSIYVKAFKDARSHNATLQGYTVSAKNSCVIC